MKDRAGLEVVKTVRSGRGVRATSKNSNIESGRGAGATSKNSNTEGGRGAEAASKILATVKELLCHILVNTPL